MRTLKGFPQLQISYCYAKYSEREKDQYDIIKYNSQTHGFQRNWNTQTRHLIVYYNHNRMAQQTVRVFSLSVSLLSSKHPPPAISL